MSDTALQNRGLTLPQETSGGLTLSVGLGLLIGLAMLLKLYLVFAINVNWDEFYYLSHVYIYLRDGLTNPLQTIHVHLFPWLAQVSDNEVEQIIAARLVLLALAAASCALTYAIARGFLSRAASLFAVLCYLAFSLIVEHQTSFRADPFGAFLFLVALAALLRLRGSWRGPALAGMAMGLAVLVTIKSVFLVPVIAAVLLWELCCEVPWQRAFLRGLVFAGLAAGTFGLLFALHRHALALPELQGSARFMQSSAGKVFIWDDPFPRWPFLARSLLEDLVIWSMMAIGALVALLRWRAGEHRQAIMLAFLLPLVSLVIYRNAFPYFYVFILSPAVILAGSAFEALLRQDGSGMIRSPRLWVLGLVAAVAISGGKHGLGNAAPQTGQQRALVEVVHELFPDPVPYIDRASMISSYSKVGFFMSSWGMESYAANGVPIFERLLREQRPRFLIVNTPVLDPAVPRSLFHEAGAVPLFEDDAAFLEANFLPHWGALRVAGKRFSFGSGAAPQDFEIFAPGPYTLEAEGPVVIDGTRHEPGAVLTLTAGLHRVAPANGPGETQSAVLRWGDHLTRPSAPPPTAPIFTGF